jgi:uncharacterized protein (DUF1330 family)
MAKAFWVTTYRQVKDATKLAEYGKLAGPAITGGGGVFLARSPALQAYEEGVKERVVVIQFESVEAAVATHDGPAYQAALEALGDGAVRDVRIVECA